MRNQISIREYARQRSCSHTAVLAAIKAGRITDAVIKDSATGRIKGIDPRIADQEWTANTDATRARNTSLIVNHQASSQIVNRGEMRGEDPEINKPNIEQNEQTKKTLNAVRITREEWLAKLAQLEYETKSGILINAKEAQDGWIRIVTEAKTKLLGLPSKVKIRIPHLTVSEIMLIDSLVREALESLAERDYDDNVADQ